MAGPKRPSRPAAQPAPDDIIDTEKKAREESEIEEGHAPRFWETDDEHQARLSGEPHPDDEADAPVKGEPQESAEQPRWSAPDSEPSHPS